ncbi:TetR/AcrR family transcriptional regulator [Streptomyces rubiginosohelvolus]|uniref:TetR/AcrR family transcriptional regulator n=1 Tax=Streptomyces rubiginosohelvolus TaxID=67362 RepID=UPI0036D879A5
MSVRRITPGRPRTKPAEGRRADLLDAAEGDRLAERQHAAVQNLPTDDWTGRVDARLSDVVRAYVEDAELHDVLYGHTPINATTEIQVSPENAHVEAFRRLITERPDPPADAPNPAMAALLIYSAWYGGTHALLHHEADDIDRMADELIADITDITDLAHRYLRSDV